MDKNKVNDKINEIIKKYPYELACLYHSKMFNEDEYLKSYYLFIEKYDGFVNTNSKIPEHITKEYILYYIVQHYAISNDFLSRYSQQM